MNVFERAARERKVARLVIAIEQGERSLELKLKPVTPLADRVAAWTEEEWATAAKVASVNEPSADTREAVVKQLELRAQWDAERPVREVRVIAPGSAITVDHTYTCVGHRYPVTIRRRVEVLRHSDDGLRIEVRTIDGSGGGDFWVPVSAVVGGVDNDWPDDEDTLTDADVDSWCAQEAR